MSTCNEKLVEAVYNNDYEKVKTLLYGGANAQHLIWSGNDYATLLHRTKNVEITRELLLHGAQVNYQNNYRETPLHTAVTHYKQTELVRELLKHGANINARNRKGNTALNLAVKQNWNVVTLLLQYGADINIRNHENKCYDNHSTSLDNAVEKDEYIAEQLIKLTLIKKFDEDHRQIIDLHPYSDSSNVSKLSSYREECISEVHRLKKDMIVGSLSLYEFLKIENLYITSAEARDKLNNQELLTSYPLYQEIILDKLNACIRRSSLWGKLCQLEFYIRSIKTPSNQDVEEKKVILNIDSTYNIIKYICNDDLENVITAFYKGISPLDFSNNGNLIQSQGTLDEDYGCSSIKRVKLEF